MLFAGHTGRQFVSSQLSTTSICTPHLNTWIVLPPCSRQTPSSARPLLAEQRNRKKWTLADLPELRKALPTTIPTPLLVVAFPLTVSCSLSRTAADLGDILRGGPARQWRGPSLLLARNMVVLPALPPGMMPLLGEMDVAEGARGERGGGGDGVRARWWGA